MEWFNDAAQARVRPEKSERLRQIAVRGVPVRPLQPLFKAVCAGQARARKGEGLTSYEAWGCQSPGLLNQRGPGKLNHSLLATKISCKLATKYPQVILVAICRTLSDKFAALGWVPQVSLNLDPDIKNREKFVVMQHPVSYLAEPILALCPSKTEGSFLNSSVHQSSVFHEDFERWSYI